MGFGSTPRNNLTAANIRDALQTLTGIDRLDANSIKNIVAGGGGSGLVAWKTITTSYVAIPGDRLRVDCTLGDVTITLPANPAGTDPDIWMQRLDMTINKAILGTQGVAIDGFVNKDGLFNPASITTIERLSYVPGFGWLSQYGKLTYQSAVSGQGSALLLLNFVGANNSTSILDTSPIPKTVGVFGNTKILGNKGIFDGNGDYLVIQKSSLDLSAIPNYTIETIFNTSSGGLQLVAATYRNPNQNNHLIYRLNFIGTDITPYANFSQNLGVPTHLALVRDAGVFRVYKDGALVNSVTAGNFGQGGDFYIGGSPGDNNIGSDWLNGEMTGFRITNAALYNAAFTPPLNF
jgi:hypothetical protein